MPAVGHSMGVSVSGEDAYYRAMGVHGGAHSSRPVDEVLAARTYQASGLYRAICAAYPEWATAKGWSFGDPEVDRYAGPEGLGVVDAVREADTIARAIGEALVIMVTSAADTSEPMGKGEKILALRVLEFREFQPTEWGSYGEVTHYQTSPVRGSSERIHASRTLHFHGADVLPYDLASTGGRYPSVAAALYEALSNLRATSNAGAILAKELSVAVFSSEQHAARRTGADADSAVSLAERVNVQKTVANSVILGPGESVTRMSASTSGFLDLTRSAQERICAEARIPAALFLGQSPGGLSTDGGSWQESWWGTVGAWQSARYAGPLRKLRSALFGGNPPKGDVTFHALGEMDETEKAAVRLTVTQADQIAIDMGILTVDEARSRYTSGSAFSFELPEALPTREAPSLDDAEAAAMVEAAERTQAEGPGSPPVDAAPQEVVPNGEQLKTLLDLAQRVARGELPRGAGAAIAAIAFPAVPPSKIADVFDSLTGFTPTPTQAPPKGPATPTPDPTP